MKMRLWFLLVLALLLAAACSGSRAGRARKPVVDSGSGGSGGGGFVLEAGIQCVDAGLDAAEAGSCTPSNPSVSFSADVSPILTSRCSGEVCHGSTGWGDYAAVTGANARVCCDGRPLIVPGSPDNSYLVHKVRGHGMCLGVRMPKSAAPLTSAEMQTIYDWICLGAKNN